jgi:hypothetical protein
MAENFSREASAFRAERFKEIGRRDFSIGGSIFSDGHDLPQARSHEDSFPEPFLAGSERAPDFGVDLASVDSIVGKRAQNVRVALFEQRDQYMFGADVIMVVIAALLLGYAQHAPRGGVKP